MSSIKPSLAIAVVREWVPQKAFAFVRALQKRHFIEGFDLQGDQEYKDLAEEYDLDPNFLLDEMKSNKAQQQIQQDFTLTQQIGVQGFPTLIGKHPQQEEFRMLTHGYTSADQLEHAFNKLVNSDTETDI